MPRSTSRRQLAAALVAVAPLLLAPPCRSQPMDLDTPADSPLWWTLSDEISPAQLRSAFRDPESHLERYQEALEAGAVSQALNEKALSYLSFYYNRRLTPELTPLWLAFYVFAGGHLEFQGAAHATDTLTELGFGPTAIDTVLLFARRQFDETQAIVEEVGAKSMKFGEIQRRAIKARGGDRRAYATVVRASKHGDIDLLLPDSGVSRSELAELRAAWLRHPATETAEKLLPKLRQQLTEDDWQRLRRFLLEHVVAEMGPESSDFDEGRGGLP